MKRGRVVLIQKQHVREPCGKSFLGLVRDQANLRIGSDEFAVIRDSNGDEWLTNSPNLETAVQELARGQCLTDEVVEQRYTDRCGAALRRTYH